MAKGRERTWSPRWTRIPPASCRGPEVSWATGAPPAPGIPPVPGNAEARARVPDARRGRRIMGDQGRDRRRLSGVSFWVEPEARTV